MHSGLLALPVRTSGSTGSNEKMCQNGQFEPAVHTFSRNWAFPIPIGRSRLWIGRSRLWIGRSSDRKCPRGFYTSDFLFIFMFFHCFLPIAFRVFSSHQACACTDAFFLCRHPHHPRLPRLPQRQRRVFTELGHYPSRQLLVKTKEASCAARNTICHERGSCDGLLAVFRLCVPFSFEFTQFS